MIRNILITLLVIGVVGTAYWGYQEHQEKNAVLLNAENNYQRAFHNLTYQMDTLHDKIGTTLAMNTRKSLSPTLAEVWRITSEAHHSVGQLPLTLLPFNKTEEFLTKIGDFSFQTAVRDLDKEPLSEKEYSALQELYGQAGDIQKELRQVQHLVLKNNLRWMDVELALASGKETTDNTIIDGFKTVEKTVEGYKDTDFGPTFISQQKKDDNFKNITGKEITKAQAIQIAKKYANVDGDAEVHITENGKGANYGFYSVSLMNPKTKDEAMMDMTKKGGYPIWFIVNREIEAEKLSLNEASNHAIAFLNENGYKKLELFESSQYDHVGLFSFVTSENGVRIYPDSIKVKVALDNGNIIGFAADDYLKSRQARVFPEPKITKNEAQATINPNVKIMEDRQAVILDDRGEEVLCYEFLGILGDDTYRIYINSQNGLEEKVEKLKNAEPIFEDVV